MSLDQIFDQIVQQSLPVNGHGAISFADVDYLTRINEGGTVDVWERKTTGPQPGPWTPLP